MPPKAEFLRACVCVCLFDFPLHVLNWFDLIDSLVFFLCQLYQPQSDLLVIWHFDSFVLSTYAKANQRRSTASVCVFVSVCVYVFVCLWFVSRFCICEKFLKLAIFFLLLPFTIVCWMFIELAIALRDCVFCVFRVFLFAPLAPNWIINTHTHTHPASLSRNRILMQLMHLQRQWNFD